MKKAVKIFIRRFAEVGALEQTGVGTLPTSRQLNLNDFAAHFLNALLLFEPVVVGHQLSEKSILQLPLGANPGLTRDTSGDLKHAHGRKLSCYLTGQT
jgi:hypothetical protein